MFGHAQRSTKDLAADRSNETTFTFGSGIEASRERFKAYLEGISNTDHGMRTILSTDGSQGCSACGFIRNLDQHMHGEATSTTKHIDFFHRRTDLPLPWQRFASQYTLDMANGMHTEYGNQSVHKFHTFFVQHLMGSGKSDVLFNIVRLLCPKGEEGRPIHRVYIVSEKTQKDFFDTFATMIDVRHNTGTYNSPFVKYAKLENNRWQYKGYVGSDPALRVEDSYAQISPNSTVATIDTDLNRFYEHAKQKIDARSVSEDTRYESLVFVFDEAHMFTATENHMKALTNFAKNLKDLGVGGEEPPVTKPMNVIFVMLSGTLLTDSASREKWNNYLTVTERMYGKANNTFAVSYLDELPLTLRPKYEFSSLPTWNGVRNTYKRITNMVTQKPQYVSTHTQTTYDAVLAACMQNLEKLLRWIVRNHERGQSHKYLLFLPTIKNKTNELVDPLRHEPTRSRITRMFVDVQRLENDPDRWITSESRIVYDDRMQRVIDKNPHVCYGIAKPGDSEYNDVLMRRFGRVKDAESDVNIDKLESDIAHLQLLITTTCTTGADFLGVSHVYFVGTPANKTEFRQNMYRAIRMCSHPLPNMQAGVKICTIGFNQTHEVCQNTIDRSDLVHRKFMANCIDAELDEHTGKVTSLYTVNAQTMPYAGNPLSVYEEYDKTFCSDVAELQDNRILKIRGDPYKYAPQFVVDNGETLRNFLRYTILPSPSVIRFVRDYEQASNVKQKMAVVLRYYYREHPSPDATHDAGMPLCRAFEKSEPLSEMNRLLTTRYKSIHLEWYPAGTLQSVLKFLVSVLELSRHATAVNLTAGEWLESDHLAMLRILDTIVYDVGNLVRNNYAYITDDKAHVVQYDTVKKIKTSFPIDTLTDPTVAILKEHDSKQNLCATVAKSVFVRLNKLRVKVLNLKEPQPVALADSSWSYSVLFRISVLKDFCSANPSIAEYLRNISVFLPTEQCGLTARAKILEHTFGSPSKELDDTFLNADTCIIYMNMTRYNDASVQHEHPYLQNIFVTPEAKLEYPLPEEQAVSDIIEKAKNIDEAVKFPCRLTEVGANNTVWYERVEVVDDFVDTMTTLVNYELGPYRDFETEALGCNTVIDFFDFFIRKIPMGPKTHGEILDTCLCVNLDDPVLLRWGLDNEPLESPILSCVFTDDSIKRFSDDRFFGVTRRLQTRLRERVFKVPKKNIFCEFLKVDFIRVLQKRMEAILNDTPEGSPRDTLRDTIYRRISELEKTQSVYHFFEATNKRKHGEMEANATEDLIPLLASFTSSIVANSEDIALFTVHNHTAQSIRFARFAVVGHLLTCMLSG
ncbi:hypothetical protein CYMTET_57066 [Cymbomonas tetramitiformis]|uniref:Uncharacterized protein n=1 Tax=Cymbomonas tetramitiformis TaxID=36881 RepID=A0AAE0BAY1_9CHLO|nr:hypothetical protein CYMTET_57066 [Cymbomonas tetramitiformis]